jgi:hypothetical protein
MKCNIDGRGRSVRLVGGLVCLGIGALLLGAHWIFYASTAIFALGTITILAGLFQIFESRTGWCAIRAMGIKTPL